MNIYKNLFKKKPLTFCIGFLTLLQVTSYFFPMFFASNLSSVLFTINDFDNEAIRVSNVRMVEDGFLDTYGLPNRQGHGLNSYWEVDNRSWKDEKESDKKSPTLIGRLGESVEFKGLNNKRVYTHYPNLSSLYYYFFSKISLIDPNKTNDYIIAVFPFYLGTSILIFLILLHLGYSKCLSLISIGFFLTTHLNQASYYDFAFRPFVAFFFLLMVFAFLKKRKVLFWCSYILSLWSSFDFFPAVLILGLYVIFDNRKVFGGLALYLVLNIFYGALTLIPKILLMGVYEFWRDIISSITIVGGGQGYFYSLASYIYRYIYSVLGVLKTSQVEGIVFIAVLVILFSFYKRNNVHNKLVKLVCLLSLSSISFGFLFPQFNSTHLFVNITFVRIWLVFIFVIAFHFLGEILYDTYKKLRIKKIMLLFCMLVLIAPNIYGVINYNIYRTKEIAKMGSTDNYHNINLLNEFWLSQNEEFDIFVWDLRRRLFINPFIIDNIEIPFSWLFQSKSPIINKPFEIVFKFGKGTAIKEINLILEKGDVNCDIEVLKQPYWIKKENLKKNSRKTFSFTLENVLNDVEFLKMKCHGKNVKINKIELPFPTHLTKSF